jgi:hypothetical protein
MHYHKNHQNHNHHNHNHRNPHFYVDKQLLSPLVTGRRRHHHCYCQGATVQMCVNRFNTTLLTSSPRYF